MAVALWGLRLPSSTIRAGGRICAEWAETSVREGAGRPAAAVHEPDLLLLDGLLDGLSPQETAIVAGSMRDLARDTSIVATGCDAAALGLACGEVLTLADGVLVGT